MFFPNLLPRFASRDSGHSDEALTSQAKADLEHYVSVKVRELLDEAERLVASDSRLIATAEGSQPWAFLTAFDSMHGWLEESVALELNGLFLYEDVSLGDEGLSLSSIMVNIAATQAFLARSKEAGARSCAFRHMSLLMEGLAEGTKSYREDLLLNSVHLDVEEELARLRAITLSRLRESDRPAYALAVAEGLANLSSSEPTFGPRIASDLGVEIASYL